MEAKLHSIDNEREFWKGASKGKKSWVSTNELEVDATSGQLIITASSSEFIGSGDRGGIPKNIRRTLTLWLSPRDLKRIVDTALRSGLLTIVTEIPKGRTAKKA
jgi:hypothetical protein